MGMSLLRFSTAGSVDDGKSTLIGRLLYDSKGVYEDQLASVAKASANSSGGVIDLALLTDGLRAEREQGITIDVAYRYFSTPKRKFIIADTPGHEQYTRNMATGASTAHLAIILIDARNGVLPQSRRHAFIANLLGIKHFVVAINKMDLVGFDRGVYDAIRTEFTGFLHQIGAPDAVFIPISARDGDNVVDRSSKTPWFTDKPLLEYLEDVDTDVDSDVAPARFPVQYVVRPDLNFRGYAGQIASGTFHEGDEILTLPARRRSKITRIVTYDGDLKSAFSQQSVTICLADEIDISRGDVIVPADAAPHVARRFRANCVWMNAAPLEPGRSYFIKHTSHQVRGVIRSVNYRTDVNSLQRVGAARLELNEIGEISVQTHHPLYFDEYAKNRITGAFIIIDPLSNETLGAGMITGIEGKEEIRGQVSEGERTSRFGHGSAVVSVEDQESAYLLERELFDRGANVAVMGVAPANSTALAAAGGFILIVTSGAPPTAVDLSKSSAHEAVLQLERLGILTGHKEQLTEGEGI
ncbi:MAG: sulfate adenylyltransferase subunit 1 [Bryobacterales bacterium]|jgi:sulfate adenylyltransferase large subunit|nr:sulfate adenylyltransferase subunit 1 [Bryobacterales bacterium]